MRASWVTMERMDPRRRLAVPVLVAILLGACSDSRQADETLPPLETATTGSAATTTVDTTGPPRTAAPTTVAAPRTTTTTTPPPTPPPTAAPTTSLPIVTAPATEPAVVTTATEPVVDGEIVFGADGIGVASFGDDPDEVVSSAQALLGAPSEDSGWVDPFTISACPGSEYRRVSWGALSLQFSDSTRFVAGRRHFFGYEYGLVGQINAEPAGLTTAEGVGVGTSVADLKASYPGATVGAGEEGLSSPYFAVPGVVQGELTGVGDSDVVMLMLGGEICGG